MRILLVLVPIQSKFLFVCWFFQVVVLFFVFPTEASYCFSLPPGQAFLYLDGLQRRVSFLQCDETSLSLYPYLSLSSNEHLLFLWRWFYENPSCFRSYPSKVSLCLLVLQSSCSLFVFPNEGSSCFSLPPGQASLYLEGLQRKVSFLHWYETPLSLYYSLLIFWVYFSEGQPENF